MSVHTKQSIDPWRNAAKDVLLSGEIPLSELSRLLPELEHMKGTVKYSLQFYKDEARRSCVEGHIAAKLPIICQRCLEDLDYEVDRNVRLSFVSSPEQAERLSEDLDPVLVGNDTVSLQALLEDELLLSIPTVPAHEDINCNGHLVIVPNEAPLVDEDKPENPFAVLASMKAGSDKVED